MPQAAIASLSGFIFSTTALSAATSIFLAKVFVYAASTFLLNRASAALAPKRRGVGVGIGTEANYYDSGAGARIVYGLVRTGGMETIPPITSGSENQFLHQVLTLACHEIDSYTLTHFDTDTITNAQIGPVAFTTSDGMVVASGTNKYHGHAFIRRYRGTSTDSADRMLMQVSSINFNNSRARGIAKTALAFLFNQEVYTSVPHVTLTYQGKRCYDPRLDATPGADPTNASFAAWTRNPALCLCDYLMAVYGGEYEADDIDWDTVVTAANYCDDLVAIPTGTQARYSCNGVLLATDRFTENLKSLVDAMLGRVIFRDGKWRIFAGSWQTPSFTIQKTDWLEGGLSIRFEQGRKRRFNQMRCWYVDPERGWQRMECQPRTNATYKAADGGEDIDAQTEQLLCTNEVETQRKAEFLLRQSRNQITVAGRLPARFQNIALWDTGTIVFDHLGWSSKTFRCVGVDMNPDGSMDCVFAEEQSTDWTDLLSSEYNSPSISALPAINATKPSAPPSFSATPQINGTILFDWTTPVVKPSGTRFQIIRSTNSANAAVGTVVWQGDAQTVPLVMPNSTHWYYVRAFANSTFSAYVPNTFGIAVGTRPEADNTLSGGIVPDENFEFSQAQSYWHWGSATGVSISPTGGVVAGKLVLVCDAASKAIYAKRTPPYPVTTGQQFSCHIRWRRTGTITVSNSLQDCFGMTFLTVNAIPPTLISGGGFVSLTGAEVNSVNEDQWQESSFTGTVNNVPKTDTQLPYGVVRINVTTFATAGTIEVSDVRVSRA